MIAEVTVKKNIIPAPVKPMNNRLKELIVDFEAIIRNANTAIDADDMPVRHIFAEGLYIREIFMAKNMVIVGKLHRHSYYSMMISGDISCLTENGIKRMTGSNQSIAPPLVKRFGYTHEDTIWQTVHPNPDNITDIDELEKMFIIEEPIPVSTGRNNEYLSLFLHKVFLDKYNPLKFRALTKEIYDHEKVGHWSDWTEEQQELYMSGDWEAFSVSRGYSAEEIEALRQWIEMKEFAEEHGLEPLEDVRDLSIKAYERNLSNDKNGEILLSSHIPTSKKIPYKRRAICHQQ